MKAFKKLTVLIPVLAALLLANGMFCKTTMAMASENPLVIVTPVSGENLRGEIIFYTQFNQNKTVIEYNVYVGTEKADPTKRVYTSNSFDEVIKIDTSPLAPGDTVFFAEVKTAEAVYTQSVKVNLSNIRGEVVSYADNAGLMDYFTADMQREMTDDGIKLTNKHGSEHWAGCLGQDVVLDFSKNPRLMVAVTGFSDTFQLRLRANKPMGGYYEQVHISAEYSNKATDIKTYELDLYEEMTQLKAKDQTQAFLNEIARDPVQTVRFRCWVSAPQTKVLNASITIKSIAFYYPGDDEPITDLSGLGKKIETGNLNLSLNSADWFAYRGTVEQRENSLVVRENTGFNKGGIMTKPLHIDFNGAVKLKINLSDLSGRYNIGLKINDSIIYTLAEDVVGEGDTVTDIKRRMKERYPSVVIENDNPRNFVKVELILYAKGSDACFTLNSVELAYDDNIVDNLMCYQKPVRTEEPNNSVLTIVLISVGAAIVSAGGIVTGLLLLKRRRGKA